MTARAARVIKSSANPSSNQSELVDDVIVPGFEAEVRELRELQPPVGDTHQVEGVLAAIEQTVDRLRKAPPIGPNSSFKANHPYRPAEEIAADYGLTACGHP